MTMNDNEIVVYEPDETIRLDVRLDDDTVWLTQNQMTDLFQRDRTVITRHINNVFSEGELNEKSNVHFFVEVDDYVVDEEDTVVSKTTGKPTKAKIYKKTKRQMYPKLAEMAMADGFKANAAFFKLGFLDKTSVSLGRQFREMLPTLWMKAGAHGPCPKASGEVGDMLILPENKFAVLLEESAFRAFQKEMEQVDGIETVYLVTDYGQSYKSMASALKGKMTYQLYRDYLDNFRINKGGR